VATPSSTLTTPRPASTPMASSATSCGGVNAPLVASDTRCTICAASAGPSSNIAAVTKAARLRRFRPQAAPPGPKPRPDPGPSPGPPPHPPASPAADAAAEAPGAPPKPACAEATEAGPAEAGTAKESTRHMYRFLSQNHQVP